MRGFFGDGIADRLMIPYARKLWTVEPAEMDFAWIGNRVPTPDVERIIAGALSDDVEQVGATAHFWYPERGGIEALPRALGERVENVHLERGRADRPRRRNGVFRDGERRRLRRTIYTLPLSQVAALVPDASRPRPRGVRRAALAGDLLRQPRRRPAETSPTSTGSTSTRTSSRSTGCRSRPTSRLHNVPTGKSSISMEISFSERSHSTASAILDEALAALRRAEILAAERSRRRPRRGGDRSGVRHLRSRSRGRTSRRSAPGSPSTGS